MKWPKEVKHRNKVLAKIYRPCEGRGSYRVAWSVNGERLMKSFPTYGGKGGALEYAEELVKGLAGGSQVAALTPAQANEALAALKALQGFYEATGNRVPLHEAAAQVSAAMRKLPEDDISPDLAVSNLRLSPEDIQRNREKRVTCTHRIIPLTHREAPTPETRQAAPISAGRWRLRC